MIMTVAAKHIVAYSIIVAMLIANAITWFFLVHAVYHIARYDIVVFWEQKAFLVEAFLAICCVLLAILTRHYLAERRMAKTLLSLSIIILLVGSLAWAGLVSSALVLLV